MLSNIQGQLERITFYNDENGYTIARLKVEGSRDLVTIVGNLISPIPGQVLNIMGEWTTHPSFGPQFKIIHCKTLVPASVHGIEKYLGSGLVKGIGPKMAKKIVKKFGKETLDIIEDDIEKLRDVEGIGNKRVGMIKKAWEDQKEIREVMLFLNTHGVSTGYATKIFKQYGRNAIEIVKRNPYRLATDIFGIGFLTADKIAEQLGFSKDALVRIEAGILYVLNKLTEEGHIYYPEESLITQCVEILEVDHSMIITALDSLTDQARIIRELIKNTSEIETFHKAVYPAPLHACETGISLRLKNLVCAPYSHKKIDPEKSLQKLIEQLPFSFAKNQIEAIQCAVQNKVMIITGGPGTGKTTIIKAIIKIFQETGMAIMLAAPTGRAAKRMSEATEEEAKTIHRMLEFSYENKGFQRNDSHPLNTDLLIVDEASMIDTVLMHHLMKAIPIWATLILVGDVNQLPSVGPGNVLKDIIESGVVPVVTLTEIFRQARNSSIIVNAHLINNGIVPKTEIQEKRFSDFYFIEKEDPDEVLKCILELVNGRIYKAFGFDSIHDVQIITPMHKGTVGTYNLNMELQQALNPSDRVLTRGGKTFKLNDKVMQIRNNYDKEIFNGDIGKICEINSETQEVSVLFDGNEVMYDYSELDELVLAYAVSVHKSQGSEYPCIIIPLLTQHYIMLQRNLVYTAITRGKKLVIMVGTRKALAIAVNNNKIEARYTGLKARLQAV